MNNKRELIVHNDPKSVGSEAFRVLRTNLQFTRRDGELKTLLVTSATPGDGKSTIAANLAVAWAQSGERICLVGCDLRKPVLHHIFRFPNNPGLSNYLIGQKSLTEIIRASEVDGLDIIVAGPIPPNPSELLQSRAMEDFIEDLTSRYDRVVLDSTPVIAVTDAAILASRVDGVILVIQANEAPRELIIQSKKLLIQANARILGVVLNGIRPRDNYHYNYYYYYSDEQEQAL